MKTRVDELKMENEYQLRLKDMSHTEKLREVSEGFVNERDNLLSKYEVTGSVATTHYVIVLCRR